MIKLPDLKCLFVFILILIVSVIKAQYERSALETFRPQYRFIKSTLHTILGGNNDKNLAFQRRNMKSNSIQQQIPLSVPFPCNVTNFRSVEPPTSVHKLKPGDIDVIGAMGDSLTAGNGLLTSYIPQVLFIENRGVVWNIGGQGTWREYLTLPNILKEFNPNLIGYSLGSSLSTDRKSQFNPAESGAISSEMPYMVEVLIKRIKSDPRVDFEKHWKMVTVLIGANDFCYNLCLVENSDDLLIPHKNDILKVLRTLRDKVPRLLVNLVAPPNVAALTAINRKYPGCELINWIECYCFLNLQHVSKRQRLVETIRKWQELDETIANMEEFQRDDFTVVFHPFFKHVTVPYDAQNKTDLASLATDCFHLSQDSMSKGNICFCCPNILVANSYWNNLLEKVGQKSDKIINTLLDPFLCPTDENPYIFTNKNS